MADSIGQIVEVYISRETARIDTASFDIPLILVALPDITPGTPADVSERVKTYTSLEAVADDFAVTSNAYKITQKLLGGDIRPARFMIGVKTEEETYTEALQACVDYNNDWYALIIESKLAADIKLAAAFIQAQRKIFGASSKDTDILDAVGTTDIGSWLKDGSYDRTFLVYHENADVDFPEAAWIGTQLPEVPGSNTWAFKGGAGVQISRLSSSNITVLTDKNVNYFTRIGGVNMFQNGTTSEGEWIDTMVFVDWLQARIQEQVFYRLATKKKIPMTQAGALIIEAEIRSVLDQGVRNGGIADAPPYTVQSPDVLLIPEPQRAQRVMGDFSFSARLAGACHKVVIRGVVSY